MAKPHTPRFYATRTLLIFILFITVHFTLPAEQLARPIQATTDPSLGIWSSTTSSSAVLDRTLIFSNNRVDGDLQGSGIPVVGVWSSACASSNITITNPSCPSLAVNSEFSVEVNVTNAPAFNAYAFFLYYDPAFINATSVDRTTGTVFSSPFTQIERRSPPGTVRLEVTNNAGSFAGANGTLAHIIFKVLAVGVSPLALATGIAEANPFAYTQLVTLSTYIELETSDGYFKNDPASLGPVAIFTYTPSDPTQGDTVIFDASASYDPDGLLTLFMWDFGDGRSETTRDSAIVHKFASGNADLAGNFSVRLTVVDDRTVPLPCGPCFQGMQVQRIRVAWAGSHDLEVESLDVSPKQVPPGEDVAVRIFIVNHGRSSEIFNLTVTYGQGSVRLGTIGSETHQSISFPGAKSFSYNFVTTGLSPGFYDIKAEVKLTRDDDSSDNMASQTVRVFDLHEILVETLSAMPTEVPQGAQVTVKTVVFNVGAYPETFNLTVAYISIDQEVIFGTVMGQTISPGASSRFTFTLDTSSLAPGYYGIGAYVAARDADPANNFGETFLFVTVDSMSPAWPQGGTLTISNLNPTNLTLTWIPASDNARVVSYRVLEGDRILATVPGTVLTYSVIGLTPEATYVFSIEAGDPSNNWKSGPEETVTTPLGPSSAPSQPYSPWWQQYSFLIALAVGVPSAIAVVATILLRRVERRQRLKVQLAAGPG